MTGACGAGGAGGAVRGQVSRQVANSWQPIGRCEKLQKLRNFQTANGIDFTKKNQIEIQIQNSNSTRLVESMMVLFAHFRPREHMSGGQVVWTHIRING